MPSRSAVAASSSKTVGERVEPRARTGPEPSGCEPSFFSSTPGASVAWVTSDVTHATDAPGVEEKKLGSHPLGSGPVLARGSTLSPTVFELLAATAEREGIDHTIEASGRYTATDADAYQVSRAGLPTGLVSIPLRYMHSPVELVDLRDVEATVELLVAFASSITGEEDLSR